MTISTIAHAKSAALMVALLSLPLVGTAQQVRGSITGASNGTDESSPIKGEVQPDFKTGFESCPRIFPTGSIGEWDGTFGQAWPAYNAVLRLFVTNNQFFSLRFTASANSAQFGSVMSSDFPGDGTGVGQISISREPGCFDPAFLGANCIGPAQANPGLGWTNDFSLPGCKLQSGQSYFLNFYFPSCTRGNCGVDMRNIAQ